METAIKLSLDDCIVQIPLTQLIAARNLVVDLSLQRLDLLFFVCKVCFVSCNFLERTELKLSTVNVLLFI